MFFALVDALQGARQIALVGVAGAADIADLLLKHIRVAAHDWSNVRNSLFWIMCTSDDLHMHLWPGSAVSKKQHALRCCYRNLHA